MTAQQRATINALLDDSNIDLGADIAEQRVVLAQMLTAHPVPDDVVVTPVVLGGVPALTIDIDGQTPRETILYFHGGVFAMGSARESVGLAADLARRTHMRVVTVDYRLAPEQPWPAAPSDALAAYRSLLDAAGDAARVAIAGESAGGNLAMTTMVNIRDAGLPAPFAGYLMSPWVDLAVTGISAVTKAELDPALTGTALRIRARDYLGDLDPASAQASPIHADLGGLPPLLVQVGSHEILLDDATRLAVKAASDDVAVILDVTPGVPHVFQAFADLLDEGAHALDRAAAFLRAAAPA